MDALANAAVLEACLQAGVEEYDFIHSFLFLEAEILSRNIKQTPTPFHQNSETFDP
jgi:hypothetical protein